MLEAYGSAIETLFQPANLLIMVIAVVYGLLVGIIPGISGLMGLCLALPFVYYMSLDAALVLLIGLHSVVHTSGGIPSILFNLPGTPPNAATTLDGYPMNQKGEGARAIGAAVTSSMLGGIVPVLFALAMVPAVMPIVLAFGQPELAALILVGLSLVGTLSSRSFIKGMISGMAGMLLSFVGYHTVTGVYRFSSGNIFLYDGIELIPLTLGLFGFSELFHLALTGQASIAQKAVVAKFSEVFNGVKDVWRHRWLWFRCTVIGYVIGIIPGVGAEMATWFCYSQAKQTSKHPERFGTGVVEGVIAAETPDNAKEAGALLTTMVLGIPGSSGMVIMLAAFMMVGVTPGPSMVNEKLPLAITLLLGIAFANILGGIVCLFAAPYFARLASLHFDFLFPAVVIVSMAGVYIAAPSPWNFAVVLGFGFLGFAMKIYNYSRPAFILGFVLGPLFERYSLLSVKIYGPSFFIRPIPLVMFALAILLLAYPYLSKTLSNFKKRPRKS